MRWDDESQTNLEGPYTLPDLKWVHNAATYDGSVMKFFEDGKQIGQAAARKKIDATDNPVWIGNDGYQQHFNGLIDEVAIFNVALTVDEIKRVIKLGLSEVLAVSPPGKIVRLHGDASRMPANSLIGCYQGFHPSIIDSPSFRWLRLRTR